MSVEDISDALVIRCCIKAHESNQRSIDVLMQHSEQCEKVCCQALERALGRGYVESGVSVSTAWATQVGRELITHKQTSLGRDSGKTDTEAYPEGS